MKDIGGMGMYACIVDQDVDLTIHVLMDREEQSKRRRDAMVTNSWFLMM